MPNRFLSTPLDVAEAVRSARASLHLTQAQLAMRAKVGRRFVVDLEAGHPRAELAKVLAVLDVLDIHALALPSVAPSRSGDDIDLDEVIRRFA